MPHAPHPPLYWRRWTFLAGALFNLLFALFYVSGVRFSYAVVVGHPTFIGHLAQALFWPALLAATLADILVAAGWLERYYHHWLNILMGCNMYCSGLIAATNLFLSLMLHAGFSEPLIMWLLVLPYQFLTVRSAHEAQPPGKLQWPKPGVARFAHVATLAHFSTLLAQIAARFVRAAQAFRDDLHDETDHEQP